ncbi:MAG: putative family peptidase [Gemmatimonadetes bacterium]|nr:putative family peptidase [Gemmatimonadota bacterium]
MRPGGKGNTWSIRMDQPSGEATQMEKYPAGTTPDDHRFAVWSDADSLPADSAKKDDRYGKMGPLARPPYDAMVRLLVAG